MTYPSKNRSVWRLSPMYQVKSLWNILRPYPKKFSSSAFNLDLVVTVSHPAEDNWRSPLSWTVAMWLLCKYTSDLAPMRSTLVFELDHDVRLLIAEFICCSIFLMNDLVLYSSIIHIKKDPCEGVGWQFVYWHMLSNLIWTALSMSSLFIIAISPVSVISAITSS